MLIHEQAENESPSKRTSSIIPGLSVIYMEFTRTYWSLNLFYFIFFPFTLTQSEFDTPAVDRFWISLPHE